MIKKMKIVLSDVLSASVEIDHQIVSSIKEGFLLLVGFTNGDNTEIVDKMVDKILNLRVFADENGLTNLSLLDIKGEILSVSQFTLYADTKKGRRPSFINALNPNEAQKLYTYFNEQLEKKYQPIQTGVFGADMIVTSQNNGPFTLVLDSEDIFA